MKTNKEIHILYVMHIPKQKAYKVGISEIGRINNRFKEIEKAFGKVNRKKSYMYHSNSAKTIKKIEQGIHTIGWKYSKEIKSNGSGKTEFFRESIKTHLDDLLYTSSKMYKLKGPIFLKKRQDKKIKKFFYVGLVIAISIFTLFFFLKK